jgi:hypothetical protein
MNPRPSNHRRHLAAAAFAAAILASPFFHVQACGPDFAPDTFVRTNLPDDLARYAQGHLGILQPGYDSDEYAIAFRYLNGGKLSEAERAHIAPPGNLSENESRPESASPETPEQYQAKQKALADAQPANQWLRKRAEYTPQPPPDQKESFPTQYDGSIVFDPDYLNCPDPAFQNATLTLTKRANTWGKQSPLLADWLKAQDAVFQNCAGKTPTLPETAPANSPALLHADRAYQQASAAFYARQYDQAIQQFQAIAADTQSPWQPWGKYLAARALVRKAFAATKQTNPYSGDLASYDPAIMQQAQQLLTSLLATPTPAPSREAGPSREAIQHELNFIRIRTEPEKRAEELSAALAGPQSDPDFALNLADLNFLLIKYPNLKTQSALLTWIAAWRNKTPPNTSLTLWHSTHALPWLVTALAEAAPKDPAATELLAAAEKIDPASPAYLTVLYHRIRLLIGRQKTDEARTLLDRQLAAMPADNTHPNYAHSDRNAFLRERFAVARDFAELLHFAPRRDLEASSGTAYASIAECVQKQGQNSPTQNCPANQKPLEFDDDAALVLNQRTPLSLLVEAATAPSLPRNLQQSIALAAWTRSVLLEDQASATKLAPLLPKDLKISAQAATGFPATLAILRNPGLRPVVEPGVSRLESYATLDGFRDNWWCLAPPQDTTSLPNNSAAQPSGPYVAALYSPSPGEVPVSREQPLPEPAIFTPVEQKAAAGQYAALLQQPTASFYLGHRVLDYAKDHPSDPAVPEALHLTVRSTRYGCDAYATTPEASKDRKAISKAAFQLLHRDYPNSPWTAKTPYYY